MHIDFKQLFALKGNYNEGFGKKKLTHLWQEKHGQEDHSEDVSAEVSENATDEVSENSERSEGTTEDTPGISHTSQQTKAANIQEQVIISYMYIFLKANVYFSQCI